VFNVDSHEVTYKDENGNETSKELDTEEVRQIIATYYASDVVTKRAENSGAYISRMSNAFKETKGDSVATAFEKALQDETGSLLTAADLEALNTLSPEDWTKAFE
jgi:hypothetical protein